MAKQLFKTDDRDKAHAKLEKVLLQYPEAECREDANDPQPFQVWSGPEPYVPPESTPEPPPTGLTIRFSDEEMDDIATRVAAKILEANRGSS